MKIGTVLETKQTLLEQHIRNTWSYTQSVTEGMTDEQRRIVENIVLASIPLYQHISLLEAELSANQINQLFGNVEKAATDAGSNRTMLGKGKDAAAAVNQALDKVGNWLQNTAPVKGFDQKFEKAKADLKAKLGGDDSKVVQFTQKLGQMAKDNPGKTAAILGLMTAAAGIAGGPVGGAIAGKLLRGGMELVKGEKISTAVGKGMKQAAAGAAIGAASDAVGDFFGGDAADAVQGAADAQKVVGADDFNVADYDSVADAKKDLIAAAREANNLPDDYPDQAVFNRFVANGKEWQEVNQAYNAGEFDADAAGDQTSASGNPDGEQTGSYSKTNNPDGTTTVTKDGVELQGQEKIDFLQKQIDEKNKFLNDPSISNDSIRQDLKTDIDDLQRAIDNEKSSIGSNSGSSGQDVKVRTFDTPDDAGTDAAGSTDTADAGGGKPAGFDKMSPDDQAGELLYVDANKWTPADYETMKSTGNLTSDHLTDYYSANPEELAKKLNGNLNRLDDFINSEVSDYDSLPSTDRAQINGYLEQMAKKGGAGWGGDNPGLGDSVIPTGKKLSEGQIYLLFNKLETVNNQWLAEGIVFESVFDAVRRQQLDEGPMDAIKKGVGAVSGAVGALAKKGAQKLSQAGKNLTTKVTADKLKSAWTKAGSPTDSNAIAAILANAGVNGNVVASVYKNMGIEMPTKAPAAAQQDTTAQTTNEPASKEEPTTGNASSIDLNALAALIKQAGVVDQVKTMLKNA